jgi:hypothetical protein
MNVGESCNLRWLKLQLHQQKNGVPRVVLVAGSTLAVAHSQHF